MSEHLTGERAKFLLVKGRAGLGNRMLAAATGILYARLTGRRVVVDWSDDTYSDDRSNVFPGFFECPSHRPGDQLPAPDSIAPALWRGRLQASVIELEAESGHDPHAGRRGNPHRAEFVLASSIDLRRLDYDEQLVVMWGTGQQVEPMRVAHQAVMPGSLAAARPGSCGSWCGRNSSCAAADPRAGHALRPGALPGTGGRRARPLHGPESPAREDPDAARRAC